MSSLGLSTSQGRQGARRKRTFTFNKGDLVLVKWADGMVYFAKIKHIYHRREKCVVVFDDKSQDEADFSQIHSVDETTTDIICIKCKKDDSDSPNEIVLCDKCGIGFHQKCHNPPIPASALQLDSPWNCSYCQRGTKCPFLTESLDVLQNLLSDDNESANGDDEVNGIDSEGDDVVRDDSIKSGILRKRKGLQASELGNLTNDRRKSLRSSTPTPSEVSSLVTVERKIPSNVHGNGPETDSPNSKDRSMSEEEEDDSILESLPPSRKRKKYLTLYQKRLKRSSVESHTVSVTRLDSPIFAEDSSDLFLPLNKEKHGKDSSLSPLGSKYEKRSLRVSLSLPDEVERRPSLMSPLSCSGILPLSDALLPNSQGLKASPKKDSDSISGSDEFKSRKQHNPPAPFVASPLPALGSKHVEMQTAATITTSQPLDVGVSERSMRSSNVVTNSVVISSSKSSAAKLLAKTMVTDDSTCSPGLEDTVANLISNESADPTVKDSDMEDDSVIKPSSDAAKGTENREMDMDTEVGSALTTIPFDETTIPTTLPVVIERSICFPSKNGESISPTISSSTTEQEVDDSSGSKDTSCILLPPNPSSQALDDDTKATKLTHSIVTNDEKHEDIQPAISTVEETNGPVPVVQGQQTRSKSPVATQSSSLYYNKEDTVVKLKTGANRPSNLFVENFIKSHLQNNIESTPAALTSVITGTQPHSPSKPQTHSFDQPEQDPGQMSKLDRALLSVLGDGDSVTLDHSSTQSTSKQERAVKTSHPQSTEQPSSDLVVSSTTITDQLVSKAIELATRKTAQDDEQTKKTSTAGVAEPDVIITGVEPSKETATRRDSAQSRPSAISRWTVEHTPGMTSRTSGHLTQTATDVLIGGPALGESDSIKSASYQVQATGIPSVDQRVLMKSPPHAGSAHVIYPVGSRVPSGYQSRPKSVIHNSPPMYYTHIHPDVAAMSQQGAANYPASVTTTKPFAIVNALPMSSSEAPITIHQKPGEASRQQYILYKDGVPHIIPAAMFQQRAYVSSPPDSTAESESMAGSLHTNTTIVSASDEKEKSVGKKIRAEDLQSIHKKIGDAFNTSSVSMLMSAFNEAWEKFQANGTSYQNQQIALGKAVSVGFANQTVDGTHEVQLVSTRPRVVVPKLSSTPVATGSHAVSSATSPVYIHAASVPAGSSKQQQQQQYILQPISSNPSYAALYAIPASSHQPRTTTAGADYPSTSISKHIQSEQTRPIIPSKTPPVTGSSQGLATDQQQHGVKRSQVAATLMPSTREELYKHQQQQQQKLTPKPSTATKPAAAESLPTNSKKADKTCSRCRRRATFLCSGCHLVWYCGRECQLADWAPHSKHCNA